MNFKSFKMLDMSTGHLEQTDCELLESEGSSGSDQLPVSAVQYEEGFYVNLANVDLANMDRDWAKFSHHFQRVLRLAKEAGFDFINFDRDGETYEDLPRFDW